MKVVHACMKWLLCIGMGYRQHTLYSTALCNKEKFMQSMSWSVRDINGSRQGFRTPVKATIEGGRSTPERKGKRNGKGVFL